MWWLVLVLLFKPVQLLDLYSFCSVWCHTNDYTLAVTISGCHSLNGSGCIYSIKEQCKSLGGTPLSDPFLWEFDRTEDCTHYVDYFIKLKFVNPPNSNTKACTCSDIVTTSIYAIPGQNPNLLCDAMYGAVSNKVENLACGAESPNSQHFCDLMLSQLSVLRPRYEPLCNATLTSLVAVSGLKPSQLTFLAQGELQPYVSKVSQAVCGQYYCYQNSGTCKESGNGVQLETINLFCSFSFQMIPWWGILVIVVASLAVVIGGVLFCCFRRSQGYTAVY
eukprot:TRINITY_DN2095_c0_g5_i1.p1 TRINITY_DN2095_c0_g5~~TRINITY_DN2095_c0_g5_i1.p1  ORF type:complete len:277 (-),score=51.48 TRINITY_DN2095_c0_g5_i1:35-865(-)